MQKNIILNDEFDIYKHISKNFSQLYTKHNCHMIYDDESRYTKEPLSTRFCLTCMTPGPGDMWKATL